MFWVIIGNNGKVIEQELARHILLVVLIDAFYLDCVVIFIQIELNFSQIHIMGDDFFHQFQLKNLYC